MQNEYRYRNNSFNLSPEACWNSIMKEIIFAEVLKVVLSNESSNMTNFDFFLSITLMIVDQDIFSGFSKQIYLPSLSPVIICDTMPFSRQ